MNSTQYDKAKKNLAAYEKFEVVRLQMDAVIYNSKILSLIEPNTVAFDTEELKASKQMFGKFLDLKKQDIKTYILKLLREERDKIVKEMEAL